MTTPATEEARTPEELVRDLRALGISEGDLVMVHASLRAIGPVQGGAAGVIEALDAAVGPTGTVTMLLGARDDWDWVNSRPEDERPALLADAAPFDPLTTPAQPDVGTLAEVLRRHPGTVVDDNPEGRFAARGAGAAELVADTPWDDYYGPGSVLARLVAGGGKVLRMGADPDTTSVLHHAEYLAEVPDKLRVRRYRKVLGPDGPEVRVVEALDDEDGIVPEADQPATDYFALILDAYLATGRATVGRVGDADSHVLDAADMVAFGARWMEEHLPWPDGARSTGTATGTTTGPQTSKR
ncbi:MAG: AAC(3) family N-acetyltransferase [Acidimicrobiales bacterium]|jgi:aminoglycoside N3'-acetyltransferase|nr:AAC(3) family N-acetyltransferase [Acidimicrobiales bacterium]